MSTEERIVALEQGLAAVQTDFLVHHPPCGCASYGVLYGRFALSQ